MSELEGMINNLMSDPDQMKKIMDMANSFMAGSGKADQESAPPPPQTQAMPDVNDILQGASALTPEMTATAMKLLKGLGGKNNEKQVLLTAMKPYLSENRKSKLERAMQLARVFSVGINLIGKDGGFLQDILRLGK